MDFPTLEPEMRPFIKLRLPTGFVKMGHIWRLCIDTLKGWFINVPFHYISEVMFAQCMDYFVNFFLMC